LQFFASGCSFGTLRELICRLDHHHSFKPIYHPGCPADLSVRARETLARRSGAGMQLGTRIEQHGLLHALEVRRLAGVRAEQLRRRRGDEGAE